MRADAPALLPILRSQPQAELLTLLLLHPQTEYSITELSVKLGVPLTTVQREINRLSQAGLINERRVGRTRVVSANPAGRYTRPLTELLTAAFGPHVAVSEEFGGIPAAGIAIYGSWAARYHGAAGPPPADVDVLVVGEPSRADIYDAAEHAEQRIGFPVNVTLASPARWAANSDALIQQIRSSPIVWVTGPPEDRAT
ncbi:MAG TPA: ArsR family transcriptional regulator [Streptosporangiaceae bacterium]|nr:ArsR family transcriptional regulator [Streptosporangiaceae bacterium]